MSQKYFTYMHICMIQNSPDVKKQIFTIQKQ